jgi:nitroreductase
VDFFEVVRKRQSIRKFTPKPVEEEKLTQILEAVNRAPSAGNLQAYQLFVVKDSNIRRILSRATGTQEAIAQAPVILVFCAEPERSAAQYGSRGEQLYCIQDATIACSYAQLAATELGLASVWIGAVFEPETIREALGFEGDLWPIALLPIGYPAERPEYTQRRSLRELVRYVRRI